MGALKRKLKAMKPELNERTRRLTLAAEAQALGRGGIRTVAQAAGVSPRTISRGIKELRTGERIAEGRIRRAGGGRKSLGEADPTLLTDLRDLVDPTARGDPESKYKWTSRSCRNLAFELGKKGHRVSHTKVARLLEEAGYSLQGNRKTKEGHQHPDRNAQFLHINRRVLEQQESGQPVISVDTKKKEIIGNFRNAGKEWRPHGKPDEVLVHDFPDKVGGKAVPYGVFDLTRKQGWVTVGISGDTGEFAVRSIGRWWNGMGKSAYPDAQSVLITADAGGSNGFRLRLWKVELQKFANRTGLTVHVCHYPPGTSKWNRIEHQLFSFISQNWRGQPLRNLATIVNLIAATRTSTGLTVRCVTDRRHYETGKKVTDQQMAELNLQPESFHGDWNYAIVPIKPRPTRRQL